MGRAGSQEDKRVKGVYRGLRRLGEVRNVSEKDRRIRGVRSKDTGTKDTISRMDDDVFKFFKYSWALTERERGRRGYWTLFDGSHLTCRNLDTFHPAYNHLKY